MTESLQARALRRAPLLDDDDYNPDNVKAPKTASLIAHRLRAQIIRGEIGEDDVLPSEAVLVERFNVSRQTLREAFRLLEAENLVAVRRGARGGATILVPDGKVAARHVGFLLEYRGATLVDVYEARETLESSAVVMLTERHVTDDIAVLRTRHDEIGELSLPEPIRFAHNALSFHQLIVELTGNQTLAVLDEVLNRIILHAYQSVTQDLTAKGSIAERNAQSHAEHEKLIGLIDEGDPSAAERHWREHCRDAAAASLGKDGAMSVLDLLDP